MPLFSRRRSIDSSSSSSSSDSESSKKHDKDKKHKDKKHHHEEKSHSFSGNESHVPVPMTNNFQQHLEHPPAYAPPNRPPPSGDRFALTTAGSFPTESAGPPVSYDLDGHSPIFVGSALLGTSVHPCKIAPRLSPPCRVPYGGGEHEHHGRYDLLPFRSEMMEWVPTSHGQIPQGKWPVEGGYEDHGAKLFHALAPVSGVMVPGKTGVHLVCL